MLSWWEKGRTLRSSHLTKYGKSIHSTYVILGKEQLLKHKISKLGEKLKKKNFKWLIVLNTLKIKKKVFIQRGKTLKRKLKTKYIHIKNVQMHYYSKKYWFTNPTKMNLFLLISWWGSREMDILFSTNEDWNWYFDMTKSLKNNAYLFT